MDQNTRLKSFFALLEKKKEILLLVLVISLALIVRAYGLDFPLYHWDEKVDFDNMLYASHNQLSLMLYTHGSFLHYLVLAVWSIYLTLQGVVPSSQNLIAAFVEERELFALLGRSLIVFISASTVALTYFLGKRLYRSSIGILAAFFLALNFLHVSESHYTRGHILATFFASLAAYFCIKIYEDARPRDYVFAGISVGLTVAAHIPLVILVLPLVVTHLLSKSAHQPNRSWANWMMHRSFLLSLVMTAVAFLVVTPYALLDFWTFAGQLKFFFLEAAGQAWVSSEGQPILLFYLNEHLRQGVGIGLEVLALLGVGYALLQHRKRDWILLTFFASLLVVITGKANFARYALPLLPFLMLFAARLLSDGAGRLPVRWQMPILSVLALLLVLPSVSRIVRFDYWLTQPDTRALAADWFQKNVPAGASVVVEGADVLGPDLPLDADLLNEAISRAEPDSLSAIYLQVLRKTASDGTGFRLKKIFRLNETHQGTMTQLVENAAYYQQEGVEYLVTVNWMQRSPNDAYSPGFQASLDDLYQEIAVFEPTIYFRFDPYSWRMDYEALSQVRLGEAGVAGPRLIVYQLR